MQARKSGGGGGGWKLAGSCVARLTVEVSSLPIPFFIHG